MSDYVWTLAEIHALPEFGADSGWFYGLVRNHETGRVRLYEVFPGTGYAAPYLRTPRSWWQALQDVHYTPVRKRRGTYEGVTKSDRSETQ